MADLTPLRFEGFTLDPAARTLVDAEGRDVPLRRSEYELLRTFLAAPGRVLSRDHLLGAVAGRRLEPFDRSVDVLVGRLRRKIEPKPGEPRLIVTVPGAGYRFAVKPQPVSAESDATPVAPAAPPPAFPERRQLTVMQCDLCGPALVSAQRDPEDLQRLLAAFHARCAAIIQRAGGTVAKRLGDTVLTYFGYPETHEDEAERAIRAALRLIETVGALAAEYPGPLQARVGIATGLVLVGDLLDAGAGEPTILGEAPKLAAKLLARADPGTVRIGAVTRRLVGDTFQFREHTPITLDGFADPLPAWEVIGEGAESRFEALRGSHVADLVGREEELSLLLRRWEQAKAGTGRAVLVMGEPGIGKSRLVRAVQERLAGEGAVRPRYFCSPQHRDSALYPVIARIKRAAGFGQDDTAATRFAKLRALLARSDASDEAVALVAALLSIPTGEPYRLPETSPQKLRESTLAALLGLFAGPAAQAPALVVFEDVHWSDPTTLELLTRIVERAASMRVLVLMTARPEFKPPWPDQAHVTTMVLNRLSDDEATMLADGVAGAVSLPAAARQRIVRHAEGVPLFVEELTKAVLESGLPADRERSAPPVPSSLHDLLLARLDRLGPAREVAQIGAVIGREFSHELLSAVAGQPEPALEQALTQIVRSELLFRSGTPPDARYAFKHVLVQQAAYESLPRSRRQELHAKTAKALLPRDPGFADPQLDLMAWHCEQGGLIEWAAALYARGGWRSASRGAFAEAHEQLANASRMVAALPEGEARDRMELAIVLCFIAVTRLHRGYANSEAAEAHRRAGELWERLGRPAEYLEVAHARYFFHFYRGELQDAQELALHLWRISQEQADPRYRIMGHLLVGYTMMLRGDLLEAESHLRDALTLIQSRSDDPAIPWRSLSVGDALSPWVAWCMAHLTLGRVKCLLGHLDQARAHLLTVIDCAPPVGHEIAQVEFSAIHVKVSSYFTEAAELAPSVERLSKLTRELGVALFDAMATIHRGHVISCLGNPEQGISLMEEGITAYAATEAAIWSGYHRALLSEAYQRLGRLHEARQLLVEARDWAERSGERWYDAELERCLGEVDRHEGDLGAAETRFKQALAIARRHHAKLWELHAATSIARLWHEQQRSAEARAVLAPVYGWFKEGVDTGSLRRAKTVLDGLEPPRPSPPPGAEREVRP